jgi:hypothetical protein
MTDSLLWNAKVEILKARFITAAANKDIEKIKELQQEARELLEEY